MQAEGGVSPLSNSHSPFHWGPGKEGGIFTPAMGLLKNLQSSFLETRKVLQPWYQRLQCPMEHGAERVPGTPSSRQSLAGGQGLRMGLCLSARDGVRLVERPEQGRGRVEGARRGTKDCITGDGAEGSRERWRMEGMPAQEDRELGTWTGSGKERERKRREVQRAVEGGNVRRRNNKKGARNRERREQQIRAEQSYKAKQGLQAGIAGRPRTSS